MREKTRWIFWHRKDLRLNDNLALSLAETKTKYLIGLYIIDPNILKIYNTSKSIAPSQLWFLSQSILELHRKWEEAGSRLLIVKGMPTDLIPRICTAIRAEGIAWNNNIEPYEKKRDAELKLKLSKQKTKFLTAWDSLLVEPSDISTNQGEPYKVYTPFLNNWEKLLTQKSHIKSALEGGIKPVKRPIGLIDLNNEEKSSLMNLAGELIIKQPFVDIYNLQKNNKFSGIDLCPCRPGENLGKDQLSKFILNGSLSRYETERNILFENGTSFISASLNFGTISIRTIWDEKEQAKCCIRSDEEASSIRIWEKELVWREFYQNALFNFPKLALGPFREKWKDFPWEDNESWFRCWKEGLTGIPIIDASMRQLKESGWMHNRSRMIVASFLVKDLICNWQLGEIAFMEQLVDGDLAANNGGWQWSASSGMDPKPLRIFNPILQAKKFDSDGNYIRKWLPEIAHVSTTDLITGEIMPLERGSYPEPIINHKVQQSHFKKLYLCIKDK